MLSCILFSCPAGYALINIATLRIGWRVPIAIGTHQPIRTLLSYYQALYPARQGEANIPPLHSRYQLLPHTSHAQAGLPPRLLQLLFGCRDLCLAGYKQ